METTAIEALIETTASETTALAEQVGAFTAEQVQMISGTMELLQGCLLLGIALVAIYILHLFVNHFF